MNPSDIPLSQRVCPEPELAIYAGFDVVQVLQLCERYWGETRFTTVRGWGSLISSPTRLAVAVLDGPC